MSSSEITDVAVVGDGVIALCIAHALANHDVKVHIVSDRRPGYASAAAAGILAPTIDATHSPALKFLLAARNRYPSFVRQLADETGITIPLHLDGVLRVPFDETHIAKFGEDEGEHARWLSPSEVHELEPTLHAPLGALLHHGEGTVDNAVLLRALEQANTRRNVARTPGAVTALDLSSPTGARLELADGSRIACSTVVLAPGAWGAQLHGLPRPLPVSPVRGQMLSLKGVLVRRPVFSPAGYLSPRAERSLTVAGSTAENVGFEVATTSSAREGFIAAASRLVPKLPIQPIESWSGLRPMTPDFRPIIGVDPDAPSLIYACGHSRNGILTAPITGDVVAALASNSAVGHDLGPFAIERFAQNCGGE